MTIVVSEKLFGDCVPNTVCTFCGRAVDYVVKREFVRATLGNNILEQVLVATSILCVSALGEKHYNNRGLVVACCCGDRHAVFVYSL